MKIPFELEGDAAEALVGAVVAAMTEAGMAVCGPDRTRPFSVAELLEETGLSGSQVRRMIEAGVFRRVAATGRALVTVQSVREWQAGEKAKKGRRKS